MNTSTSGKIQYLEGLRGVAALAVVIQHLVLTFYPSAAFGITMIWGVKSNYHHPIELFFSASPFIMLYSGRLAVIIFFILSGFVLSYKFMRKKEKLILIESIIRRYFRLTIPIAFSCVLTYFFMKIGWLFNKDMYKITYSPWISHWNQFAPNFAKVLHESFINVYSSGSAYNSSLWTMQYELNGSFLVFFSLFSYFIFSRKSHIYLFYGLLCLIFFLNNKFFMICFLLGIILCELFVSDSLPQIKNKINSVLLSIVCVYLCSFPYVTDIKGTMWGILYTDLLDRDSMANFYYITGAFLLIYLILISKRLQDLFSTPFARFLGKISFSMYIMHLLIILSFTCFLFKWLLIYLPYDICALISSAATILLVFVVSWYVYRYVDLPSIQFSQYVVGRLRSIYGIVIGAFGKQKELEAESGI
jgi:peptidoglycan/LPS O-acetylase OafA/YrhL